MTMQACHSRELAYPAYGRQARAGAGISGIGEKIPDLRFALPGMTIGSKNDKRRKFYLINKKSK